MNTYVCLCVHMCVHAYVYRYTHTHKHTLPMQSEAFKNHDRKRDSGAQKLLAPVLEYENAFLLKA